LAELQSANETLTKENQKLKLKLDVTTKKIDELATVKSIDELNAELFSKIGVVRDLR